jgi:hypothetical protein
MTRFLVNHKGETLTFVVDDADADRVAAACPWHVYRHRATYYVERNINTPDGRRTTERLHRFLVAPQGGSEVDHIDGNGLDNVRANLRLATRQQNAENIKQPTGSSQFRGVSWYARGGKWHARLTKAGRSIHLGYFAEELEAARVVAAARAEHMTHAVEARAHGAR